MNVKEFMAELYKGVPPEKTTYLFTLPDRATYPYKIGQMDQMLEKAMALNRSKDVYFGLHLMDEPPFPGGRASASDIRGISFIHGEYRIPASVLEYQSLGVDTVSSATDSSKGLLNAIEDAVVQAGGNVEELRSRKVVKADLSGQISYLDTDVCVIGGGISGSIAAIQASDLGANVILLEKTASTGVRGGAFFVADSHLYQEVNMEPVDVGVFFKEYMEDTSWRADGTLVRDWLEMSKGIVGFLEKHGCKLYKTLEPYSGGHSYAGGFGCTQYETSERTEIEQIADALKCVEERGGKILCDTTATGLIQDETGAVVGVVATCADGSTLQVNAKSVIIATGGYICKLLVLCSRIEQ